MSSAYRQDNNLVLKITGINVKPASSLDQDDISKHVHLFNIHQYVIYHIELTEECLATLPGLSRAQQVCQIWHRN